MILLLDNYDSFTYNLAQYLGELGCRSKCIATTRSLSKRSPPQAGAHRHFAGPCTPQEAGISVELVERLAGKFPILGRLPRPSSHRRCVWRQNYSRPETLPRQNQPNPSRQQKYFPQTARALHRHALPLAHRRRENLSRANSQSPPKPTTASSWASATAATNIEGVQFHPESVLTESGKQLLQNFLSL